MLSTMMKRHWGGAGRRGLRPGRRRERLAGRCVGGTHFTGVTIVNESDRVRFRTTNTTIMRTTMTTKYFANNGNKHVFTDANINTNTHINTKAPTPETNIGTIIKHQHRKKSPAPNPVRKRRVRSPTPSPRKPSVRRTLLAQRPNIPPRLSNHKRKKEVAVIYFRYSVISIYLRVSLHICLFSLQSTDRSSQFRSLSTQRHFVLPIYSILQCAIGGEGRRRGICTRGFHVIA